jgi:phospholipid/cholesterol/gamma-HCH transport system substrate-binding protein
MKKDNLNYLMVGIFTLSMLILLIVVLYRLTGRNADADLYYAHYTDITGIKVGTAVSYGGYQIGQVDQIDAMRKEGKTQFRLTLALQSGWKIPGDSVARIVSPGMLSDKQVDIQEGDSKEYLKPGAEIKGKGEASIMSVLNSVAYEIQELSDESVKPFIKNLNQHMNTIGADLGTKIPEITAAVKQLLKSMDASAVSIQELLSNDNRGHVESTLKNIDNFSARMLALSSEFDGIRGDLDKLLNNSNSLVQENRTDLRQSVLELRQSLEAISKSINSIVYNLDATSRNMNEFSRQVRENPGLLLGGSPQQDKETARSAGQ